ncbi:lipopolysaccharide biosynthesis protein [Lutibacter sp.]
MKKKINNILEKVGIKSQRTKNITKHIGLSVFYKIGAVIANFLLVPLTINYLDTENYGIWLTLSSFISWFSLFDIGLGNGLRNKLAESVAVGKMNLAQAYVSTTYYAIAIVSFLLFLIFFGINFFIDWTNVFNTNQNLYNDLRLLMPIVFGFFCLQFVVKLITTVYLANQHHSIQVKIQFITQVLSLLIIWFLTKTSKSSLLVFGAVFSALPVILLLFLNLFAFTGTYQALKPKYSLFQKKCLKDLMGIGINFFIIQIAALVLFSTDNLIISKLFSPAEVVPYNIAFKYFSIVTMAYSILITPYWSSFTDAYAKKDYEWIKKSVKNIQKIWLLIPVALLIMILISNWFYHIWVGDTVAISIGLTVSMALFVLLTTFNMVYVNFINGVGKIKLQLITSLISMTINIPLSIYFAKYLGWGVNGVILATCFSLGYSVILRPIQYYKIINNNATAIWDK